MAPYGASRAIVGRVSAMNGALTFAPSARVGRATHLIIRRDGRAVGKAWQAAPSLWIAALDAPALVVRGGTLREIREKIGREVSHATPGQ
jgi:hypothetical protein